MDEQPSEPSASEHAEVDYELDEWSTESRELLDRLLTTSEVNHAWQGGTLSVGADDQGMVEELIGDVEATLLPALDPEAEKVVYEVAEWSPEDRADLTDALADEGVRYVFDDMGDLVVEAIDEDRVDTLVDELTAGEDVVDEDIPVATEVLSGLFVAADKLRKSPRDGKAILAAREQAEAVIALPPPYGFERRTWAQIGLRAGALRVLLEEDGPDDEVVSEAAEALRDLLHPMV
ncbi:MAG TPA: hypothetical protein VIT24_03185 [Acidimicrobiales bacterium]